MTISAPCQFRFGANLRDLMNIIDRTVLVALALMMNACTAGSDNNGNNNRYCFVIGCTKLPILAGVRVRPGNHVVDGDTVVLEGGTYASYNMSYIWKQLSGPSVAISDPTLSTVRFKAPSVTTTSTLSFRFTAKTPSRKDSADVAIVVEPTSASALCLQGSLYATIYVWTNSGCTTDSDDIVGDSRIATLYRQSEAELNDSLQTANSLIFPAPVSTEPPAGDVFGSIDDTDDDGIDIFVFTPPSSGDYHVYLCNDPLACMRGTVSEDWFLRLYDQDSTVIAQTTPGRLAEQKVMLRLNAGLPYYVGVIQWNAPAEDWQYNLTIIRD